MSANGKWLSFVVATIALGLAALLLLSDTERQEPYEFADSEARAPNGSAGSEAGSGSEFGGAELAPRLSGAVRNDAEPSRASAAGASSIPPLVGRVLQLDGTALAHARVQWTPLKPAFDRDWPLAVPWDEIRSASRITIANEQGEFSLELPPQDDDAASVVWASKVGFEPSAAILSWSGRLWTEFVEERGEQPVPNTAEREDLVLRVSSLSCQSVHVELADGSPAIGSTVRMLGQARIVDYSRYGERLGRARRVFFFDSPVDSNGNASLPAFATPVVYQAVRDHELSDALRPTRGDALTLVLAGGLRFDVRVELDAGCAVGGRDAIAVSRQGLDGDWTWLGGFALRSDGTSGPHTLAGLAATEFQFLLQSETLITTEARVLPWRREDVAHVQLAGKRAAQVRVHVVADSIEEPLQDAVVQTRWLRQGSSSEFVYGRSMLTDEQGWATVGAPADQALWVSVSRTGYGEQDVGALVASADPIEVRLVAESTLRGRVVHAGAPVSNFTVTYWLKDPLKCAFQQFTSDDGSFVLESMPQDAVTLYAVGGGFAQCQPVLVDLRGKPQGEVVLELPTAVRGRGRVIDANTRRPLDGVVVKVYTSELFQMLTPSGVKMTTAPDGLFELDGFAPSYSSIYCLKDGYAPQYAFAIGKAGEEIDFGFVSMAPDDPYCMQLEPSAWPGLTVRSWAATGAATVDGVVPDALGRSCIQGVKPGLLSIGLVYSDRSLVSIDYPILPGGAFDWTHTIGGSAAATIQLRGTDAPECRVVPPYSAALHYVTPEGRQARRHFELGSEPNSRLEGIVPGRQVLVISDSRGPVARRTLTIDDKTEQEISLDADCGSRCLQVLTQTGEPYAERGLMWCQAGDYHFAKVGVRTNSQGEFCIPGSIVGTIELTATESGFVVAQPVLLNASREPRQVVQLAPLGDLAVRLLDQGAPQTGIVCILQNESSFFQQNSATTNEQGVVRWEQLSMSMQRLYISGQGLWNQSSLLVPQPTPAPVVDVQVYGLGDVALKAIDPTGFNVAGATFDLVHQELHESASSWLSGAKITSSTNSLTSGQDGKLVLTGLPRGKYAVSVELAGGKQGQGVCDVLAGKLAQCVVAVP